MWSWDRRRSCASTYPCVSTVVGRSHGTLRDLENKGKDTKEVVNMAIGRAAAAQNALDKPVEQLDGRLETMREIAPEARQAAA